MHQPRLTLLRRRIALAALIIAASRPAVASPPELSEAPNVSGSAAVTVDPRAADMFCGPRCVKFLLDLVGRREELFDLIEEIQERDWRRGASLASMDRALRRRGLHTAAIRVHDAASFRWPEPAIVHLRGKTAGDMGHFVVQLPGKDDEDIRYWCGLAGVQTMAADEAAARRSGVVLLTSTSPIDRSLLAVKSQPGGNGAWLIAAAAAAVAVVLNLPERFRVFFCHGK